MHGPWTNERFYLKPEDAQGQRVRNSATFARVQKSFNSNSQYRQCTFGLIRKGSQIYDPRTGFTDVKFGYLSYN